MNIMDIVALAKQGFTPGDIKEIINLANETSAKEPEKEPANDSNEEGEQKTPDIARVNDEPELEKKTDAIDYKSMYDDAMKQNAVLQGKLEESQKSNVSQTINVQETKDTDLINDLVRSFM